MSECSFLLSCRQNFISLQANKISIAPDAVISQANETEVFRDLISRKKAESRKGERGEQNGRAQETCGKRLKRKAEKRMKYGLGSKSAV
jgi:hypothetical protein